MNLQQLKYIVEIDKARNITQAAKNLYMGQPNLSKALKELEDEMGTQIFTRTAKGVKPTEHGYQFLRYARNILDQMSQLQSLFKPITLDSVTLSLSIPRATYISVAVTDFINEVNNYSKDFNISFRETSSVKAIDDIITGQSSLGIIRYHNVYESYFLDVLKENQLQHQVINEFNMAVLMSNSHPLSDKNAVKYEELTKYIEILHGDYQIPDLPLHTLKEIQIKRKSQSHITVYDRGSQYDALRRIPGSYVWVSPMPQEELLIHGLTLKQCSTSPVNKDVLIFKNKDRTNHVFDILVNAMKNSFEKSLKYCE